MNSNLEETIIDLKNNVIKIYKDVCTPLSDKILRGHSRSISTDIEDKIAIFIHKLLPNYDIYIDSSIFVDHKIHRPDILLVKDEVVKAVIEIKSILGFNRDASNDIDKLDDNRKLFANVKETICTFSNYQSDSKRNAKNIQFTNETKYLFIVFASENCSKKQHNLNREYAKEKNICYYILFDGWWGRELIPLNIKDFCEEILNIK